MNGIPLAHSLLLASALFALGLLGVIIRRNILFVLMCIEMMINAAALAFVAAGSRWSDAGGQVFFLFILTLAAAETSVGLAMVLQLHRRFHTLDTDAAHLLRG